MDELVRGILVQNFYASCSIQITITKTGLKTAHRHRMLTQLTQIETGHTLDSMKRFPKAAVPSKRKPFRNQAPSKSVTHENVQTLRCPFNGGCCKYFRTVRHHVGRFTFEVVHIGLNKSSAGYQILETITWLDTQEVAASSTLSRTLISDLRL